MDDRTRTLLITGIIALILVAVAGYIILRPESGGQVAPWTSESNSGGGPEEPQPIGWEEDTIVIIAEQDAYIDEHDPSTNHEPDNVLKIGDLSGDTRLWSFIDFDILSVIPEGSEILNATLTVVRDTYSSGSPPGPIYIHVVVEAWDESEITWNNQPTVSELIAQLDMAEWSDIVVDVTDYVQGVVDNTYPDYGLRLSMETDNDGYSDWCDYINSERSPPPQIEIHYKYPIYASWIAAYGPWLALGAGLLVAAAWLLKSPKLRGAGR